MLTASEKLLLKIALFRLIGSTKLSPGRQIKIHLADVCIVFTADEIDELVGKLTQ